MALAINKKSDKPRVVVLGGGNGTSRLLRGLLPLLENEELASLYALVNTSDDGGSTGKLRDQYAVGALGDLTKCLTALSSIQDDVRGADLIEAMNYRFSQGDFQGHTLRNILLAVFELTAGDIDSAIAMMARLLQIPKYSGVIPATLKPLTQQVEVVTDGERQVLGEGQHFISHNVNLQIDDDWKPGDVRVSFKEDYPMNERAAEALAQATHIVVAPGHTYGTILPALASPGLQEAVKNSSASVSVVMTLLTTPKHTTGWSGEDFVKVYESYLGKSVDAVVANTGQADVELVEGQDWVSFVEDEHSYELIETDLVSTEDQPAQAADVVPRAIVVHDNEKIRELFRELLAR